MSILKKHFERTVDKMVQSLIDEAEYAGVDLSDVDINNFNYLLDELFNDGGEVRCKKFTDIAIEYALGFGELETWPFMDAQWKCIDEAIYRVARYFKNKQLA